MWEVTIKVDGEEVVRETWHGLEDAIELTLGSRIMEIEDREPARVTVEAERLPSHPTWGGHRVP